MCGNLFGQTNRMSLKVCINLYPASAKYAAQGIVNVVNMVCCVLLHVNATFLLMVVHAFYLNTTYVSHES